MTRDEAFRLIHKKFGVALLRPDRKKMMFDLRSMGFAIVPLEPTAKMMNAGAEALHGWIAPSMHSSDAYSAMIAAYEKEQGDG